jgi:predicted enzyme related to lactoylglutathione lyase
MNLKQTRLLTNDVVTLTRFYEGVTRAKASVLGSGYVEFRDKPCEGLAIGDPRSIRSYGDGVAEPGVNRSAILDFEVADVDAEYEPLQNSIGDWVQPPTDRPWGNRAMLFRDPDGNLINMFSVPRRATNG